MKKFIVILFMIVVSSVVINEEKNFVIPKDAIRFRIIANSNEFNDQEVKMQIKTAVENKLYNVTSNAKTMGEARGLIKENLPEIEKTLDKYNVKYSVNFGKNYFPNKEYKGLSYDDGFYESLVIKLGSANGENWWCVLFPPLCLLDDNQQVTEKEYKSYAINLINKVGNK